MELPKISKKKKVLSKGDKAGMMLLAGVGLVVVMIAIYYIGSARGVVYDEDNCPPVISSHTIVLIDLTDPLTDSQVRRFKDIIGKVRETLSINERISIHSLDGDDFKGLSDPILSLCKPRSGKDANEWTENPYFLQRRYDANFAEIYENNTVNIAKMHGNDKSPILEALFDLSYLPTFNRNLEKRRLVLISDLVQNSDALSMLTPNWQARLSSPQVERIFPVLPGVELELFLLMRDKGSARKIQEKEHFLTTWNRLFSQMFVKIISIEKVR